MNIRQINIILITLLVLTLIGLGYEFFDLRQSSKTLEEVQQKQIDSYLLAYELRQGSDDLTSMITRYVATGDKKYENYYNKIADIRDGREEIPQDYHRVYWDYVIGGIEKPRPSSGIKKPFTKRLQEQGFTQEEFDKLAESFAASQQLQITEKRAFEAVQGVFEDIEGNFTVPGEPDFDLARALINDKAYLDAKLTIMRSIDQFFALMEARTQKEVTEATELQANQQFLFVSILVIALILIAGIIALGVYRNRKDLARRKKAEDENEALNDSVINILEAVNKLSQKDLTVKAPVTEGIIGTVSDSINALSSETAQVLMGVTDIAGEVRAVSNNVKKQADQVTETAENEREDVQNMVESLFDATQTMNQVSALAEQSNQSAGQATKVTNEALGTVNDTVEGMESIRETISETEKRIKRLGERSQEISGIVNLIDTISERTHVLALNASMQAAVAGEAGRGFAVVAEEVQRLAESSRNATQQIATLVNNIQIETNETINTVNKTIGQVVEGSTQAQRAGEQMQLTQKITEKLVSQVRDITLASQKQKSMSAQLLEAVQKIGESTEQTAEQIEAQNAETDVLLQASSNLVNSVGVFKLPNSNDAA